jgi:type VI secretion system protein ImpA
MGKTLYETMRTLLPDHVAKAVVPVGQASFRLPVSRLAESLDSSSSYSSYSSDSGSEDDSETKIEINTRKDAMKMIDHINAFIKSSEPASPLPVLLTRAKELSDRDFLSLLKDIFDPNTLEVLRHEGSGGTNW